MNRFKIVVLFLFVSHIIFAQDIYLNNKANLELKFKIIGFAGKNSFILDNGTLIGNEKKILSIKFKDYQGLAKIEINNQSVIFYITGKDQLINLIQGKVSKENQLVPFDYWDIQKHFQKIEVIRSKTDLETTKVYLNDSLSFGLLYRTDLWKEYIQQWVGLYIRTSKSPDEFANTFIPVAFRVLDRTSKNYPDVASNLAENLIEFFEQYNLSIAAQKIAAYSLKIEFDPSRKSELAMRLINSLNLIGKAAPLFTFPISDDGAQNFIILFYESDCPSCERELELLQKNYIELKKKGIEVVTISSDIDNSIFEDASKSFPWKNKFCDYKGLSGENFKNYGVIATPTFYLIDKQNIILGKYATLCEIGIM